MLRLALPLSVALLATAGAGPAEAATVIPVTGEIRALAFSGDALVMARLPPRGGLRLERLAAGSPAQTILATAFRDDDDEVSLAASAQALAFGLKPDPVAELTAGRVSVGGAGGPLREVATCPAGLIVSPVSVAGARIAWREGGCGVPVANPSATSPAAVVIGGVDAAAPVRRVAIAPDLLPIAVVLGAGDTGLVGLLRPSFFGFDTEVRAFSPAGLGATIAADRARLVTPVGILADGTRVLLEAGIDDDEDCDARRLVTVAPRASERRPVPLAGCFIVPSSLGPRGGTSPVATGDRIVAFVGTPPTRTRPRNQTVSIVSVRSDGSDRRTIVKGRYRQPEGVAADGARVAWWQPRCAGGREIVVQPAPEPATRLTACRAEILTRSARARGGRIAVRVRCPTGCTGTLFGLRFPQRDIALAAGTHRLRMRVALGRRRAATVRLDLQVAHGPSDSVRISVRR